jgi:hypothetical protein
MADAQYLSDMQRARVNARWRKARGEGTVARVRSSKVRHKVSAANVAAIAEVFERGLKQIQEQLAAAGLSPTQLPVLSRINRSRKSEVGVAVPAVVPEVNAPLFIRSKARMRRERGNDLPTGYWGRKQRLYLAAMEEAIEETKDEMYRIVGLAHLLKETGNMIRGRGEMACRITEEEERAIEAEVAAMSDEELAAAIDRDE